MGSSADDTSPRKAIRLIRLWPSAKRRGTFFSAREETDMPLWRLRISLSTLPYNCDSGDDQEKATCILRPPVLSLEEIVPFASLDGATNAIGEECPNVPCCNSPLGEHSITPKRPTFSGFF